MPCPVCSRPANVQSKIDYRFVECPACGTFGFSDLLNVGTAGIWLEEQKKEKLRFLLCERRLKKIPPVMLTDSPSAGGAAMPRLNIDELLAEFPQDASDYFDRALLNLSRMAKHPTDGILLKDVTPLFIQEADREGMMDELRSMGLVRSKSSTNAIVHITSDGWLRIAKLNHLGRDSKQAFVAMWFDSSRVSFFEGGIKPAIEADAKTRAVRIDGQEHNGKIDDAIIAEIRRSRYLVADFTGDRGGIYFEAGFALGLGLPVIWCVDKSDVEKLHFDTRQYNHIVYTDPDNLRVQLLNRIRATILI